MRPASSEWITVEADRALYVDRGVNVILCDRLPSPVTLLIKLARDSDGSPKGGDGEAGSVRSTTARAEGIAQPPSEQSR